MDSLINMVAERSGISEDKAKTAVDTVVGFLKEHAPAGPLRPDRFARGR